MSVRIVEKHVEGVYFRKQAFESLRLNAGVGCRQGGQIRRGDRRVRDAGNSPTSENRAAVLQLDCCRRWRRDSDCFSNLRGDPLAGANGSTLRVALNIIKAVVVRLYLAQRIGGLLLWRKLDYCLAAKSLKLLRRTQNATLGRTPPQLFRNY
jgi:hypothetical protein